jgi:hypothetical protein
MSAPHSPGLFRRQWTIEGKLPRFHPASHGVASAATGMEMQALARTAVISALVLSLAGCSRASFFSLENQSGQDVVIERRDGTAWRLLARAPAAQSTDRIPISSEQRLRVGECTYKYGAPESVGVARPRVEHGGLGPPYTTYLLRLEPDFTLRLFNAAEDGAPGEEVISSIWPAQPTVECRTKG